MLDRRSARPVTFPVISSGLHLQIFDIIKLLWLQIKSGLSQSLSSFISVLSPSPYINQLICVTQQQVLCKEKHLELLSSTIASCVPGCLSALSEPGRLNRWSGVAVLTAVAVTAVFTQQLIDKTWEKPTGITVFFSPPGVLEAIWDKPTAAGWDTSGLLTRYPSNQKMDFKV